MKISERLSRVESLCHRLEEQNKYLLKKLDDYDPSSIKYKIMTELGYEYISQSRDGYWRKKRWWRS